MCTATSNHGKAADSVSTLAGLVALATIAALAIASITVRVLATVIAALSAAEFPAWRCGGGTCLAVLVAVVEAVIEPVFFIVL